MEHENWNTENADNSDLGDVVATEGKLCPECGSNDTINYVVNNEEIYRCFNCGVDFRA